MNESIIDIGESLASAYRNKITDWSALEFTFSVDDLPASFGLADDILRLEEGWKAFAAVVQTSQTDYLPQNLFETSNREVLSADQQPQPPHAVKKVDDYPFTLLAETGVPFDLSAALKEEPAKNKIADNTNLPIPESNFDFSEVNRVSSSHIESKHLSSLFPPDNSVQPVAGNVPASSATEIINLSDLVQNQSSSNPDKFDSSTVHTPQQSSVQETVPNEYSASIWSQPLQNLGDFATQITYSSSKRSESTVLPRPVQPTENSMGQSTAYPGWLISDKLDNRTSAGQPSMSEQPDTPGLVFTTPLIRGSVEPLSEAGEIADFQPENQPFQSTIPPPTFLPDTDDLLEALTERIIRDFRRYYP